AMDEAAGKAPNAEPRPVAWEPPTGAPTRLILVRHGETALTAERRYSGRGDVPLSPHGTEQVRAIAARLAGLPVTAVHTSPLSRCTATADAIAAATGNPPVTPDTDLVECDF